MLAVAAVAAAAAAYAGTSTATVELQYYTAVVHVPASMDALGDFSSRMYRIVWVGGWVR